jgi:integrase
MVFLKSTKGRRTRNVRMSPEILRLLEEHRKDIERDRELFGADYEDKDLVFPKPDGSWQNPDRVTTRIATCTPSLLLSSKSVPITVISERLGHAKTQLTLDVYSHMMESDDATAPGAFDQALGAILDQSHKGRERRKIGWQSARDVL